jgi:hypothetical protein
MRVVRARVVVAAFAAGALSATGAGCASLLGDFGSESVGDAGAIFLTIDGSAGEAGPSQGSGPDGATPSGGGEAGTPLACTQWRYAEPVPLEALGAGNRRVMGTLSITSGSGTEARVIAGKSTTGVAFSAYYVDKSGGDAGTPAIAQRDAPSVDGSEYAGWARGGGGATPATTVLAYAPGGDADALGAFTAYVLPDSLSASGSVPAPYPVFVETPLVGEVDGIRVLPIEPSSDAGLDAAPSLFATVVYPLPSATGDDAVVDYVLGVGVATGGTTGSPATLASLAASTQPGTFSEPHLLRANGQVYVLASNGAGGGGISVWATGEDGGVAPGAFAAGPRTAWAGMPGHVNAVAPSTGGAAADLAFEEQLTVGGYVTAVGYFAGAVPYASLAAWDPLADAGDASPSPTLAPIQNFTNVFNAPDGIPCGSLWTDDNLMLLGPGLAPADDAGSPATGLNMLWFDVTGAVHGLQSGSSALLQDRQGFSTVAASPAQMGTADARWDVAWVETRYDDVGAYDVVFYNELDCSGARGDAGLDAGAAGGPSAASPESGAAEGTDAAADDDAGEAGAE